MTLLLEIVDTTGGRLFYVEETVASHAKMARCSIPSLADTAT